MQSHTLSKKSLIIFEEHLSKNAFSHERWCKTMKEPMSDAASEILHGLQEALLDARGVPVKDIRKSMGCRGAPEEIMTAQLPAMSTTSA